MSDTKRLFLDIHFDNKQGYTNICCDSVHIVQVYGEASRDVEAIADLACKNLRAEIIRQLERLKDGRQD